MKKFDPVDYIAIILTFVVSTIIIIASVRPFFEAAELSSEAAKLISGLEGSLISIISLYVGAKIQKRSDEKSS